MSQPSPRVRVVLVWTDPGAGPRAQENQDGARCSQWDKACFLLLIVSRDSHGKHNCLSEGPAPRNPS